MRRQVCVPFLHWRKCTTCVPAAILLPGKDRYGYASNYFVFRGLLRYGYTEDARELAEKTVLLLGRDYERFGALHEYYMPDNGEPILNKGFQNWNLLVLNMAAWLDGKETVNEFNFYQARV